MRIERKYLAHYIQLGEGKYDLAYDMSVKLTKVGLVIGVVIGIGVVLFGKPILSLFGFTEEGFEYASKILVIYGATLWLSLYNAIHITGTLRCGGDTRFAMVTEVLFLYLS